MNRLDRQFFSLLRSGLRGGVPDVALFQEDTDWEALYTLSADQTVVGLVTDGIHRLPPGCLPADEERLDPFLGDVLFAEGRNRKLNLFLTKLIPALNGLRTVVVKGQPVAALYPDPLRRQCGDIDLLLPPEDYEAAKARIIPKATKVEEEAPDIMHIAMFFGSVELELHGTVSTLMSPSLDRRLKELQAQMFSRPGETCSVDGFPVPVADARFNAVYVFVHFVNHYFSGGVGLRQLIDWSVLLEYEAGEIDRAELRRDISFLGMTRLWHAFLSFIGEYLGTPQEVLDAVSWKPLRGRRRNGRIWRTLRRSGNFGKNTATPRGEESYWVRKVHSFLQLVVRDRLRHFLTFPLESLRFFFGAFGYGLGRLAKGE